MYLILAQQALLTLKILPTANIPFEFSQSLPVAIIIAVFSGCRGFVD